MPEADKIQVPVFENLRSLPARRSLGQSVYQNLKHAIVKGDLAPESRVVESRVANALGISRTPVREAIHKLGREGLLRQDPKGGFFVVGVTREDIEETFGIRSVLESYAAKLAAIRHLKGELQPLEEKLVDYQRCLDRGDLKSLPRINTEFHDLLYGLSRSPRLIKMINDLRDHIYRFRLVILKIKATAELSNKDHRLMLEAMIARDTDGVESLVKEHILRGQDIVLREFDMERE
ncbi:MAG: GntR family transcriptional regulator [Deltaproteobacteria bacterium]|nr:GntR family transcriptional regulator [Deltaproteobacteria bacterium]